MEGLQGLVPFLAQDEAAAGAAGLMGCLCPIVIYVALAWAMFWKVFEKASQPGWMCFVPILNACKLAEIAGRPAWWGILTIIPVVGLIIGILICLDLAKKFGKDTGFAVGLILLGFVFFPILGFGSATYDKSRT